MLENMTRDQRPFLHPESLQILQIHSSMLMKLIHLTHFLQGSDQRTGMFVEVLFTVTHFCVAFEVCIWIIVLGLLCLDYWIIVGRSKHGPL